MRSTRRALAFFLMLIAAQAGATSPLPATIPTVGMPTKIDQLVLPGSELEAKPLEDRQAKVVVRVVDVFPHGTAFRYNLIYYGLEPGQYDLKDWLRRKDGSSTSDLPKIPVTIHAILPEGQIEPNALGASPTAFRGGYRAWMILAGVLWFVGLLAIVFVGRRKRSDLKHEDQPGGPSLADRLRPLVDRAMAGTLAPGEHAELERTLIGYWRKRLGLETATPSEAIAAIKSDERAGPLIRQLEEWLHQPDHDGQVDVAALLEPYRDLPAEVLEGGPAVAGRVG